MLSLPSRRSHSRESALGHHHWLWISPFCGLETPTVAIKEIFDGPIRAISYDIEEGLRKQLEYVHMFCTRDSILNVGGEKGDFNKVVGEKKHSLFWRS